MTLREQCEAVYDEQLVPSGRQAAVTALERFCLKQQAVGLREAAERLDEFNDDMGRFDPYLQRIVEWCEQRAREREGGV